MLQGWATLAGVIAVVYAARVGSNTFEAWRRQKQEERRMDAAEQILTFAYRLRDNLRAIRSIGIVGGELAKAEVELTSDPDHLLNSMDKQRRDRATVSQVVKMRLAHFGPETAEVWKLQPTARALFGSEVEARLNDLWQCHVNISVAADEYADVEENREYARQVRRDLFSSGEPNPINETIATAITALELELLPVIRANFSLRA